MVLVIKCEKESIYEEVRTVNIDDDSLVYYRTKHYSGERHEIPIIAIQVAYVVSNGEKINII